MTKKQLKQIFKRFCINHTKYSYRNILQAYKQPSKAKVAAWKNCVHVADTYNGKYLSIISRNTFIFTVGFIHKDNDDYIFMHITPNNLYKYKLDDDDIKLLKETFYGNI